VIPVFEPYIGDEESRAVDAAIKRGEISGSFGEAIPAFERRFADYVGVKHGVATTSGTTALELAVASAGIGRGDEVLVSASTNIATALAAYRNNAVPVPVDSEPETWNIDLDLVEGLITERTKAIIPVHLFGHPVDMDRLMEIANKHDLLVIEDCAESHGATVRGRMSGSFGQMNCFSFYANKIITTGEGGMVVTDDDTLADTMRSLRNQGRDSDGTWLRHVRLGYNYRLDEMSAAVGVAQLERLAELRAGRDRVAAAYGRALGGLDWVTLPAAGAGESVDWFVYVVRLHREIDRDTVLAGLGERGVPARPYFSPLHLQPFYRERFGFKPGDFPVTERVAASTLALPFSSRLPDEDVAYVAEALREVVSAR